VALDDATEELIENLVAHGRSHPDAVGADGRAWTESVVGEVFLRQYFDRAVPDDLGERPVAELFAAANAHAALAVRRPPRTPLVRVYQPDLESDGWTGSHTVIDVVSDDMAFLVDSMTNEVNRHDLRVHLVLHPVIPVRRDASGVLIAVGEPPEMPNGNGNGDATNGLGVADGTMLESLIHIEVDRLEPQALEPLRDDLLRVLEDVARAVEDWRIMAERALRLSGEVLHEHCPASVDDVSEASALLAWMAEDHFTFLGYREYDLVEVAARGKATHNDLALREVPGTGLGILRQDEGEPALDRLSAAGRAWARSADPLVLAKANSRSTVHRSAYLDYIGVKRFDDHGAVIGERRFLGLFTSGAYNSSVLDVPVVRRKVPAVIERAALPLDGHANKVLVDILETYPRDELFQISVDDLFTTAIGILRLQERQRVRVFVRRDQFERFVSCLVYVPRDQYTTVVRERMAAILKAAFMGKSVDFTVLVTESVLARLHLVVHTVSGAVPDIEPVVLEEMLVDAIRSWNDDLYDALIERCGEAQGVSLYHLFGEAFPASYREEFDASSAVEDILRLDVLQPNDVSMSLYRPLGVPPTVLRLKIYLSSGRLALSDVVPLLEALGVTVVDERPHAVLPAGGPLRWIYDFGLQVSEHAGREIDNNRNLFIDALRAVWNGQAESDGFNRLVLEAGIPWRNVSVLRAYRRFQRQVGSMFSDAYVERCLAAHGDLVRLLMAIFDTRLNPERPGDRAADLWLLDMQIDSGLDAIESLDEDRILRAFRTLVMATSRTNFYQRTPAGQHKPVLSLKFDPTAIPDLPLPRPMFEVFVYSPRVEGVHLRGGKVARGGIRWSDRREDFRTEILGLMKAQMVKNSVIVPSGAKGGFVVKQPPPAADREAFLTEGAACYRLFIAGLLDITDNLVGDKVVPPPDVMRKDGDDPYLVVAADKGTATFSDLANELSVQAEFWLGDAFASGGSYGYDHKRMGITARGAWESVKRHFRELGIDTQRTDFTAVGIGDMSGDVFGNAMLLSPHIRLVAAFDHRHIFLDPNPDAAASFAERRRLFDLGRSSWNDYDPALISEGGGVFPRTAKSIPLTPQVKAALAVDDDALTPDALVHALLLAPVDLLFNGGIGTYVKASAESHAEVGDKANDAVRVDGAQLRCRVVGEGGNLGFTQRGRVEFARTGGCIYPDAIDNSAGVDCSDHEVNIKILLDTVERDGVIDHHERDELLVAMTDDVAASVLLDNYENAQALSIARAQALSMAEVHGRYITDLVRSGRLDRKVEFLPSAQELAERGSENVGLTSPELAVLLAYTKVLLCDDILASTLPEDPFLASTLASYFPPLLRERFTTQLEAHPLKREIVATTVSNRVVNHGGTSMLFRLADETQATWSSLARCHLAAAEMFEVEPLWQQIEALDNVVSAETQMTMLLVCRRLVERATRWLVMRRKDPLDLADTIGFFGPGITKVSAALPLLIVGDDRGRYEALVADLVDRHVPRPLAERVAGLEWLFAALDNIEVSEETGHDLVDVAGVSFGLVHRLHLDWLRDQIGALPRDSRWHTQARASIRADLYERLRSLTVSVLLGQHTGAATADELIDAWASQRERRIERYHKVLADLNAGDTVDLAVLSVAVRAVHDLSDS